MIEDRCRRGHEYTATNTYMNPAGARVCRACKAANDKARRRPSLGPDDPRHGTDSGYRNNGCRCDACRGARRETRKTTAPWVRVDSTLQDRIQQHMTIADMGHTTACWLSDYSKTPSGYARIEIGRGMQYVHRVSYELYVGPIPPGLEVDHLCRVRHCCNPDHLEPVTRSENCRRAIQARKANCA